MQFLEKIESNCLEVFWNLSKDIPKKVYDRVSFLVKLQISLKKYAVASGILGKKFRATFSKNSSSQENKKGLEFI